MVKDIQPAERRARWLAEGFYDEFDLYSALRARVAEHPQKLAVIDDGGAVTYAEFDVRVRRLAHQLELAGVQPGDTVAVQLPNTWLSLGIDFAIAAVGAVTMPFPAHYREQEVSELLTRSAATTFVVGEEFAGFDSLQLALDLRKSIPTLRAVLVDGPRRDEAVSLHEALAREVPASWTPPPVDPASPCRVLVTSGTESGPKMVLYNHQAVGRPFHSMQLDMGITPDSRLFPGVPLGSGMGVQLGAYLSRHGGTVVLIPVFKAGPALAAIERHAVTHFYGVPTMVQMMLAHSDFGTVDTSSLTAIVTAGSALAPELARSLKSDYGWESVAFYGCSEGVSCNTNGMSPEQAALSVGDSDPRVSDLRVVDAEGKDAPAGVSGEVWGLGPFTPLCYIDNPAADARYAGQGGWVKTGDLGVLDAEGRLSIVGRLKEIIVRGGFNISPIEVENLLLSHPDITQAACVGIPDERLGERVCAVLVVRDGAAAPSLDSLGAYLLDLGLSKYKLPEKLVVLEEMPTNPAGKILKRVLRERLLAGTAGR